MALRSSNPDEDFRQLIDVAARELFRLCPGALFRLAGLEVAGLIRHEDTSIRVREKRADNVFVFGDAGSGEGALYLEIQMQPQVRILRDWLQKYAALTGQFEGPVVLLVLYLLKGGRASFPERYESRIGGLTNHFQFATVRLWEHADRIRSGEVWELAPLLVLCVDSPEEDTLREEIQLIENSEAPDDEKDRLLFLSFVVGRRVFSQAVLDRVFEEIVSMTELERFIEEAFGGRLKKHMMANATAEGLEIGKAIGEAQGEARGEARGKAQGKAQGAAQGKREMTLLVLESRFGDLPLEVLEWVGQAEPAWCEALVKRVHRIETIPELRALLDEIGSE